MLRHSVARASSWHVRHVRYTSTVNIGGINAPRGESKETQRVPKGFVAHDVDGNPQLSQETLSHLRWMLQKDLLQQDIFLLGPPGPARRRLALQFCEILNREVEYVAISQDTTESDLKQRREITNGAATFSDQAPVRAAVHGRVLILDGLEKAERNVLPTLNNLLENREMALEDGRFLMNSKSFDALLQKGYKLSDLESQNLLRVDPAFRVIALGVPVPPFPGRPLDPPLRSRFQARQILPLGLGAQLDTCAHMPNPEKLVSLMESLHVIENAHDGSNANDRMPHFSPSIAHHCANVMHTFPNTNTFELLRRSFPLHLTSWKDQNDIFQKILASYYSATRTSTSEYELTRVNEASCMAKVDGEAISIPCGPLELNASVPGFFETNSHRSSLIDMLKDHAVGSDMCLVGPKGSGKSALARLFCTKLGYSTELFTLFKDMTARDLMQRRATDSNGNTTWEDSPLLRAARYGHVAILDGIHRLSSDTLSTLQRLIQDREVDLPNGVKFSGSIDETKDEIIRIHPSFRIIALAELGEKHPWLTSETLTLFPFHSVPANKKDELRLLLTTLYPRVPAHVNELVLNVWEEVDKHPDLSLSLRQLLRIARRLDAFPEQAEEDLRLLIEDTTMMHFLPAGAQMEHILNGNRILSNENKTNVENIEITQGDGYVQVGNATYSFDPTKPIRLDLIPQPLYYDTPKHTLVMQQMLQDVMSGQPHLLLIGNQGVGKNKVVDHLLELMHQEREYVQLHRDTTVQTLTLVPSLANGKITWEDSPLVRAVKEGRTLVVDEADKAPLEVVCVLKGLIEDGEMLLGDGRRIVDPSKVHLDHTNDDGVILMHPSFRMWVLANRPGFPFLGNNFFSEVGDIFATHVIDNPDEASELALLRAYAPNVSNDVLVRLCAAFSELRAMVDDGSISYPYSTREAVAVAKHLNRFPQDGVSHTLENVLAFDSYDLPLRNRLRQVFARNGIPLLSDTNLRPSIQLATATELPGFKTTESWNSIDDKIQLTIHSTSMKPRRIYLEPPTTQAYHIEPKRLHIFSEEISSWQVPLWPQQIVTSMAVLPDKSIHVLTKQPLGIHSYFDVQGKERTHLYSELEGGYGQSKVDSHLAPWKDLLVMHVPSAELLLVLNHKHKIQSSHLLPKLSTKQTGVFQWNSDKSQPLVLSNALEDQNLLVRYAPGLATVQLVDVKAHTCNTINLPSLIQHIHFISKNEWFVEMMEEQCILRIESPSNVSYQVIDGTSHGSLHVKPNLFTNGNAYLERLKMDSKTRKIEASLREKETKLKTSHAMDSHLIVNHEENSLLEIIDLKAKLIQTIQQTSTDQPVVSLSHVDANSLLSVQKDGLLRLWQVDQTQLKRDLSTWKAMFHQGLMDGTDETLALHYLPEGTSIPKTDSSMPKHGKEDPDNTPHVGGNTWAGGTGGSDTAGLGGRGGPYRLDKGHKIHQISQEKKDEVSKEAREKAKKMAQEALAQQLKQIDMSKQEHDTYLKYFGRIVNETTQLRHILKNVEQLSQERGWLKHQSNGEWDDAKLIDGLTGERNIFKRRGEDPFSIHIQPEPKRLLFVVDVSGSISHGRLERMLETTMMLMESLAGFESKFDYAIVGHSGDAASIPLVGFGSPPKNRKDRLKILEKMVAHSQYCSSGDHTVEAIYEGIKKVKSEGGSESFVFVVSDANLKRYGIQPQEMARALERDSSVSAHAIFIASLADEASNILKDLPQGKGHVCLDTGDLPLVFKKIFKSNVAK